MIGAFDDFRFEVRQDFYQSALELRSLIAGVGEQLRQEGIHPEHGRKQQDAAVAILNVCRVDDGVQQQAQRVYENMAFLPLDFLACIIAMRPTLPGQSRDGPRMPGWPPRCSMQARRWLQS